jgi:outer membrane lipoprotein-sorting protein
MRWLALILVLAAAPASAESGPAPSAEFDRFFADYAQKREGIHVLEARFEQKTIYPDEILTTEGDLIYARPRRIVFRTEDPERTTLVDGQRVYEYEPEIKQAAIYDIGDNPQADIFFFGFDNDTEALRKSYDVRLVTFPDETRGSKGLLIKPKPESAAEARFVEVTLYLRDADYLPYRIRIVNDEESQVIVDITGLEVNGKIDPARTQLPLAEGTRIIDNDVPIETVGAGGKRIPEPAAIPAANVGDSGAAVSPPAGKTPEEHVKVMELPAPASGSGNK